MNESRHSKVLTKVMLIIAFALLSIAPLGNLLAQPTNYCIPYPKSDFTYNYCYYQYGDILRVTMTDLANGAVVLDRQSANGADPCYLNTGVYADVKLGKTYRVDVTCYAQWYYYEYVRLFIDWNHNGSFTDPGDYIGITAGQYNYNFNGSWTVTVPCSMDGATGMRVIAEYYYGPTNGSNACNVGWVYPPSYNYVYGTIEDYYLNPLADIESTYPPRGGILYVDEEYNGTTRLKNGKSTVFGWPNATMGSVQPAGAFLTYKIVGPKPSANEIYVGRDPITNSPNIDMGGFRSYNIKKASGPNAINYYPTGNASVTFTRGGEYKVAASVSGSGCPGEIFNSFTASWDNDLAVSDAVSPKNNAAPRYFKYLRGQTIRVTGLFQNVGLNDITEFWGYAYIVNNTGDTIYRGSYHFDSYNNPGDATMKPSNTKEIDFPTVKFNSTGTYKMYFRANLLNATDMEAYNDVFPRTDDPNYIFEISYEIELASNRFLLPVDGQTLVGNRPIIPTVEFKNNGVGDASDVPAKLNVYKLPRTGQLPAYTSNKIVQDVPAGKYNLKVEEFDVMILRESGTYEAEMIISHPDDVVRTNDTLRIQFTINGGLVGTYTCGTTYGGASNNFPTVDSLMNALYYRGLAGPTTIEFTDATYDIWGTKPNGPAWDLSTFIINLGWDADYNRYNTLTFKPSVARSLSRGAITFNLHAPNGKGILFGQSMNPTNPYSVYTQYATYGSLAKKYANNQGYIIFDGGAQKAFKFRLYSNSGAHAAAFYLQRGSSNINIQNCLIENASTNLTGNVWLPMTSYNPVNGFGYQPDTLISGSNLFSYSAGIVSRATLMGDLANRMKIDTLPNKNNLISGNEITGFGYGILSLGYGQVLMENQGEYKRFYNQNNEYSQNIISNCTRAGIYLGYEENSNILNNRIFSIGNNNITAAGIMAGGDMTRDYKGYNNINLYISANEVSGINSSTEASGIRVLQSRNIYPHPTKTQVFYPDVPENMTLVNNIVWGLTTNSATAERYGVRLFTERTTSGGNAWTTLKTAFYPTYLTSNDRVVNNTIMIGNNGGLITTGAVAAIAIQQTQGAYLRNNAIALTDIGVDPTASVYSSIFIEGPMSAINSDRNVFWIGANATGTIGRLIELDPKTTNIIDEFDRDAFKTMTQWRTWTNQDNSSILGNFTTDLTYLGAEPNQRLRINLTPQAPLGSYLNNRGERISWVTTDVDGNVRGQSGQRYDVGASEFTGRMYISDVEMLQITYPSAYKSNIGTYSDAEYFMTKAPCNVKVNVRNNGNLMQSGIAVTCNIYRELPNGTYSTSPEVTKTILVDIPTTETIEANFQLDQTGGFTPKTYGALRGQGYYLPDQFVSMEANVTPKYKIVISLGSDQQNANNTTQKIVRYYIQKSNMRILLSAEHSMVTLDANSTQDVIAGRLNYDSLKKGMKKLGWIISIDSSRFDYDVFDRYGWEVRAVNYRDYRTMIWTDGADKPLTRLERMDMQNFLNTGNVIEKKNLIIGSQGYVRQNSDPNSGINQDLNFVNTILRAVTAPPENPLGLNGNNNGNWVVGMACERDLVEKIASTGYTNDLPPYCGLMTVSSLGEGLAQPAYKYWNRKAGVTDSIMGVSTSTLTRNVLMYGVDWRHWGNVSMLIRGFIDYIEKNGGTIIPVELLDFNAVAAGNRVDINWATASEYKSDRFDVERATINQTGKSDFSKISEVKAAGNSSFTTKYGPVVDYNVEYGNKYAYRLKMVDLSGQWKYSNEVEVSIDQTGNWLGIVTPNPATSTDAKFIYSVAAESNVAIGLYDLSGKKVIDIFTGTTSGEHTASVNTGNLLDGVYTVVMNVNGVTYTRQLNVAK